MLTGNPVIRKIPNYRKTLIVRLVRYVKNIFCFELKYHLRIYIILKAQIYSDKMEEQACKIQNLS